MAKHSATTFMQVIRTLTKADRSRRSDRDLLHRYANEHDQSAFAALVRRHGSMVLGVCQRVLPNLHDAEDACQAAFLILAQKAGSNRWQPSVANWLFATARKVARNARVAAQRRTRRESKAAVPEAVPPLDRLTAQELLAALDEELDKLPARYREPLVLCCLEGLTRDEAATRLCVPAATLKVQLERGRKRLGDALSGRGLVLGSVLLALAATSRAGASPSRLAESILAAVSGSAPGAVAALAKGVAVNKLTNKVVLLALTLIGTIGLSLGLGRASLTDAKAQPDEKTVQALPQAQPKSNAPSDAKAPRQQEITVRGRVLDPDGKPVAGAKLYYRGDAGPKKPEYPVRATSGDDGRFAFTIPKAELDNTSAQVLAMAESHGCDWMVIGPAEEELTLRLVKDEPIKGRILDTDGKPVIGAKVIVRGVSADKGKVLAGYLDAIHKGYFQYEFDKVWDGPLPWRQATLTTDSDGRFKLSGMGRERVVRLLVEGPAIATAEVEVMTRAAETVISKYRRVHGASFDYVAAASRLIRGVVRDKETNKALAGVRVVTSGRTFLSDAEGRFEILGSAKSPHYWLKALPANGQLYFTAEIELSDTAGFEPLNCEFKLVRGIPVRGKVVEEDTGKSVSGARVHYHPLWPNPFVPKMQIIYDKIEGASVATTGKDGSFELAAFPGPGVLAVECSSGHSYMTALLTRQEVIDFLRDKKPFSEDEQVKTFMSDNEHLLTQVADTQDLAGIFQRHYQALALIELDEKTKVVERDVKLKPGRTLEITVTGPDGKTLPGATVTGPEGNKGRTGAILDVKPLAGATFTLRDLNPARKCVLLFQHKEKGLGLFVELRGDQKGPFKVQLAPYGAVAGRILDKDGQPMPGFGLELPPAGWMHGTIKAKTDREGKFRAEGLLPGRDYRVQVADKPSPLTDHFTTEPGKNKDLGDIKVAD
jgi:RNA polymerase sigma factor (sigma-70 family)